MMKRALLATSRRCCTRQSSTEAATAAEVPEDPDILTTEPPEHTTTPRVDPARKYPRLQYRPPTLGVNPAYDLALEIIKRDRVETRTKHQSTKAKIARIEQSGDPKKLSTLKDLKVYMSQLEDLLDMNDPEVHWRHAQGDVDYSMPIYRHLARKKWSERDLLLTMQRVTQMSVTPDVIPIISPILDVRLSTMKGELEVGKMISSRESASMPTITIQSFDAPSKKYTIAIIDPDVPDEANDTFTSFLHYLQTDVCLSSTSHLVGPENGKVLHAYIPPHPDRGTPYHRYTVLVWEQPEQGPQPNAPLAIGNKIPRHAFDAQAFAQQNGLHAVGIHFWRQVWDDQVARIMSRHPDVSYKEKNFRRIKA